MSAGTAAALLSAARATIGQAESPSGSNRQPFAACAGHANGQPWCATWVVCMTKRAGVRLPSSSAYTPSMANGFRAAGRFGSRPAVGAIVFFQWPSMGRIAHVGIVEAVRADGSIVTIEGNTDAAGGRTGGRVMRHVRRANIVGYGYPEFARPAKATVRFGAYPGKVLKRGSVGRNVVTIQTALGVRPTGGYGKRTAEAVADFQAEHGLDVDGKSGPRTWEKYREVFGAR